MYARARDCQPRGGTIRHTFAYDGLCEIFFGLSHRQLKSAESGFDRSGYINGYGCLEAATMVASLKSAMEIFNVSFFGLSH